MATMSQLLTPSCSFAVSHRGAGRWGSDNGGRVSLEGPGDWAPGVALSSQALEQPCLCHPHTRGA